MFLDQNENSSKHAITSKKLSHCPWVLAPTLLPRGWPPPPPPSSVSAPPCTTLVVVLTTLVVVLQESSEKIVSSGLQQFSDARFVKAQITENKVHFTIVAREVESQ